MFNTFKDAPGDDGKHHAKNVTFVHILPQNDSGKHIEQRFCECVPFIDSRDISKVIHNRFDGKQEIIRNARW